MDSNRTALVAIVLIAFALMLGIVYQMSVLGPTVAVFVILAILGASVALKNPGLALGGFLFSGLVNRIPPLDTSTTPFVTIFLFFVGLGGLFLARRREGSFSTKRPIDALPIVLTVFSLFAIADGYVTGSSSWSIEKPLRIFFFSVGPFFLASQLLEMPKMLGRVLISVEFIGALFSFGSLILVLLNGGSFSVVNEIILSNEVIFGRACGLTATLALGLFLTTRTSTRTQILHMVVFVAATVVTVLSGSRQGVLGIILVIAVVVFVVLLKTSMHNRRRTVAFTIIGLSFLLISYFSSSSVQGKFLQTPTDDSILNRFGQYQSAWNAFLDNPLTGAGPGNYVDYAGLGILAVGKRDYPHNLVLEVAAELGVVGLVLITFIFVLVIRESVYLVRIGNQSGEWGEYVPALLLSLLFSFLVAQFSGDLPNQRALWFFVALLWTVYRSVKVAKSDQDAVRALLHKRSRQGDLTLAER